MGVIKTRNYKLENAVQEPVVYLANLMNLQAHIPFIRKNKDCILPVLSGVLLYRQLNHTEKRNVLPQAKALGNVKFFGAIQTLLAQNLANPAWNKWCLSDGELRNYFESNKLVSELIGTWFFTVEPKLEVAFLASSIFSLVTVGIGNHAIEASGGGIAKQSLTLASKKTGISVSQTTISNIGRSAVIVTVLASVMKMMTDTEVKKAREELLRRGLLTVRDLQ
ncbi:hypothetical protein NB568_08570 [Vibrio alginolyticus]|uniref:hypothetical protein n=1 Tax=Vibrio TaxID=662 RepID=UPI0006A7BEEB|nr:MULTISPECIES: hypothetical protein [Vibrio]MBS9939383.1 hypothetical protein [Vibrio alginolyticus]MBT0119234.1 hypothetical protein [Vibrio alginolyticus]MCR9902833.1 hypothetical protein [Vibrio alginolyticus]MCR9922113.1 hypothetical protein [Vibrio alginolyticus]MDF4384784.1 hypothetical protein [Vibrio parahaemolyticus]